MAAARREHTNCASEPEQKPAGEGDVILKIAGSFLIVIGLARIEVTDLDPQADRYSEYVQNRTSVKAPTEYKSSRVRSGPERRRVGIRGFKEAGVAATERQPGRKTSRRMEFHADVRSQKNNSILIDDV